MMTVRVYDDLYMYSVINTATRARSALDSPSRDPERDTHQQLQAAMPHAAMAIPSAIPGYPS